MSDAYNWASDALTPDKAKVRSPQINAGYGGNNPDARSSQYAMSKGQRDVAHYQPGAEMSAPLQNIADRGQARGDLAQQHLSSASANAAALGGQSLGYGEKGYNAGMAGAAYGAQQGAALNAAGGKGGALGSQYGNAVAGQGMAGAGQAAAGQGMAGAAYNDMRASAGQLAGLEAQQGPSAAQAQLRNATNAGQAQNLAMARSGGGFGGSASRSAQAMRQNAAMNQGAANQSAMLSAQENAAWRQRQASNLQGAGGMYGQSGQLGLGSGQLGLAGNAQAMQGLESGGQLALAGNAQNLQGLQAGTQAGMAGHNMALQGSQVGLQGTGQALQSQQAAGQLAATGYGLGFQGDTQAGQAIAQDQAAKQAYENMLTQQMGIQAGVAVGNAQASNAFTGQLLGAAAGAGMMAMSDERRKNVGRQVNMSSELYGNPYGRRGAPGAMASDHVMSDERNKRPPRGETTLLSAEEEARFQEWGRANGIRDLNDDRANYDYRGFWRETGGSPVKRGDHFPDTYKQHGHETFSNESKYSRGGLDGGRWLGEDFVDLEPQRRALEGPSAVERAYGGAPSLRGVPSFEYEYDDPSMPGAEPGLQVGPMAQDIERAIPGAVDDTPQGKMVNPGRTVLPLLSAVGEQQARIDALEARLNEQPDLRTAENAHRPKGPSGLSFEAYDDAGRNVPDAPNFLERRQEREKTPLVHNQFARAAGAAALDTLMAPVTLPARALAAAGYPNKAAELDGGKAIAEVESLVRDETLPQSLERQELGAKAHPKATMAGSVAGDVAAGAALGGALKAAPGVKRAGKELATEAAARAYDSPLNVRSFVDRKPDGMAQIRALREQAAAKRSGNAVPAAPRVAPEQSRFGRDVTDSTGSALPWQEGSDKVFISDAHRAFQDRTGSDISLPEFKKQLLAAHRSGEVELSRLDLVSAAEQSGQRGKIAPSAIGDGDSEFHFIRRPQPKAEPDYWDKLGAYVREDPTRTSELGPEQIAELQKRGVISGSPPKPIGKMADLENARAAAAESGDYKAFQRADAELSKLKHKPLPRPAPAPPPEPTAPVAAKPGQSTVDYLRSHPNAKALDEFMRGSAGGIKGSKYEAQLDTLLRDAQLAGKTQPGETYRGIALSKDELASVLKNGEIKNPSFWSSSNSEDTAWSFAMGRSDKQHPEQVLLKIRGQSGVPVRGAGGSEHLLGEEEVLFGRDKRWSVRSSEKLPDGRTVIEIDEVPTGSEAGESAKRQLRESADESEYKSELADAKKYGMARAYAEGREPRLRDRGHKQHSLAVSRQLIAAQKRAELAEAGQGAAAARHNRASLRFRAIANREDPFKTEDLAKELSPEDSYWHNMADYVKNTPGGADEIGAERIAELRKRGLL